jgi:5'-3' exonuclease
MPRPPTPFSRRLSNCQSHLEISSRLFAIRRFLESVFVSERLFILDAHSLIYQLFHAIPEMTSPSGVPTNAVFGFVRDILQLRKDRKPDYLVCAFDTPAKVFRSDIDPNYKAHRPPQPDDLRPQIPLIVRVLQAFRIPRTTFLRRSPSKAPNAASTSTSAPPTRTCARSSVRM